ncbi:ubiquitin-protein ligase [Lithospermum erythrorhizon]|uniref:Ubiquitin-protein ligase n=1 Tax=Lithospermum erythrorhizon TaxID=34254 RepID=A0AAV3R061_LITER
MERETPWVSHYYNNFARDDWKYNSFLDLDDEGDKDVAAVSLDLILPDDLLERIIAYLPIPSIFRAGCVCKRWHEIVSSRRFLFNYSRTSSQKPWYYMFTGNDEPIGYAYDPVVKKWYNIELPQIQTSDWSIASSCGLVCFMDNNCRSELYVCNPIANSCRRLRECPEMEFSDHIALAISVNRMSHKYIISVVQSKQVPGNYSQFDLSIHLYDSETMMWVTPLTEVLTGWRGRDESVICNGILYFLIYSTAGDRYGLMSYNLSSRGSNGLLAKRYVPVPFPLTCGRLMNMKEKLIMVGGIAKQYGTDIIKGIGIWVLNGNEWQEIARMPHKFFQGFGEVHEVFASSGTDDLIYIQSYTAPALLSFELSQQQWRWSQKCPVTKRFPLQLFSGFCFEPRLVISP